MISKRIGGPAHGNGSSTPWESQYHAMELTVPRRGTRSPKAWNSQSQRLELTVPKPGTHGPKAWNSRSQRLELTVPKAGTHGPKGWKAIWYSHVSKFQGCNRTDWSFKQTLQPESPERRWTGRYHQGKRYKKNPLPCRKEQRTHINDLRDCTGKMSEAYSPWAGAAGCSAALPSAAAAGASPCAGACCSAGLTLEASKPGMPCGLV